MLICFYKPYNKGKWGLYFFMPHMYMMGKCVRQLIHDVHIGRPVPRLDYSTGFKKKEYITNKKRPGIIPRFLL